MNGRETSSHVAYAHTRFIMYLLPHFYYGFVLASRIKVRNEYVLQTLSSDGIDYQITFHPQYLKDDYNQDLFHPMIQPDRVNHR